jgi:hypothetical protein
MSRAAIAGAIGRLARIPLASTNAAKYPGLKSAPVPTGGIRRPRPKRRGFEQWDVNRLKELA